jgi:hypothetical protein
MLNLIIWNTTTSEWRKENLNLAVDNKNLRYYASEKELLILANLENINVILINYGFSKQERFEKLNKIAKSQFEILNTADIKKKLKSNNIN